MPGFNGQGPQGAGPMTGGGRGFCVVPVAEGTTAVGAGRGFGRGAGRGACRGSGRGAGMGRGFRRGFAGIQPVNEQQAVNVLKSEAAVLKTELDAIEAQISTLEKKQS